MTDDLKAKKEYLLSYKAIEKRIQQIEDDIHRMRIEASGAKAIQYSDMPKGSTNLQSPQETYMLALDQAIGRSLQLKAEYISKKEEIKRAIHKLGNADMESLLEYKYIDSMTIRQISEKMGYERTQLYRIHDKAMEKLKIN